MTSLEKFVLALSQDTTLEEGLIKLPLYGGEIRTSPRIKYWLTEMAGAMQNLIALHQLNNPKPPTEPTYTGDVNAVTVEYGCGCLQARTGAPTHCPLHRYPQRSRTEREAGPVVKPVNPPYWPSTPPTDDGEASVAKHIPQL